MERKWIYVLSFLLPVTIMLAIFVERGIYPFGDRSFLFSDMYHQYMPFFSEFMRKMKAGEGLSYSYNVGIGSNFLALYVYYLASPLHWFAFLVPEAHLMEFMSYLVVVKIGLAGLTFCYYVRKRFGTEKWGMLFFSVFYALSGFLAAYNWNIMWLDCVVLLPLIILGLERLVKEGKCGLYCITLALSIFTNYYISIMICIFLVLHFMVLFVTEKRSVRAVWQFALYSLLAAGMASVLLIPEVCAILATDFGNMDFPEKVESYFSVLDMLARHCMCVTTERGLDHWPNIYCGVAVFLLLPMYVLNDRIPIRQRFARLAVTGFILLGFSTNILDFIWHGLNYPDSLPARQSFLYIFLVLTMCYEAYEHVNENDRRQILYGYLGAVVFLLFCEKFVEHEDFSLGIEWLTLLFVSVYAILLYLHCTRQGKKWRLLLGMLALAAVVAESTINTDYTSIGTVSRSAYLGQQEDYQALYQWTVTREQNGNITDDSGDGQEFYRLEKFTRKTKNDSTLAGFPSASVFSSTMNSGVMDMYTALGMRHSKVYYGFDGATAFTAALLNVKYMFGESEKYESSLYTLVNHSGDVYLYESNAILPFGYVAPVGFDLPEKSGNSVRLQNTLMDALGVQEELLTKVTSKDAGDDVRFTAKEPGTYYGRLTAGGTGKMEVIGGVLETQQFNDLKDEAILYLGYLDAGETLTLTNGDEEDETQAISVDIYRLNEAALQQALEVLAEQHLTNVTYDSTHVQGKLALTKAGRLILSIPYEKGWTVLLNGEEVEPELFGGSLMAFDLEPGEYELSMHYVPAGSCAGAIVTAFSVVIFAGIMLYGGRLRKKREREIEQSRESNDGEGKTEKER